jgi:hypothetical protein
MTWSLRIALARLAGAEDRVGIVRQNRRKPAADVSFSERRVYVEPVMDRELPLVLFAALIAAVVLVAIQLQSSAAAQKKEATLHTAYRAAQHRPDSRLASSQFNFGDTSEQRLR